MKNRCFSSPSVAGATISKRRNCLFRLKKPIRPVPALPAYAYQEASSLVLANKENYARATRGSVHRCDEGASRGGALSLVRLVRRRRANPLSSNSSQPGGSAFHPCASNPDIDTAISIGFS